MLHWHVRPPGPVLPIYIVEPEWWRQAARAKLYAKRRDSAARRESRDIFDRHGSRKRRAQRQTPQTHPLARMVPSGRAD